MTEPPDHHDYGPVLLYEDTLKFLLAATQFYESLLRRDIQDIASDPDLKLFVTSEESERFSIHEEFARAERVRTWLDGLVKKESRFGAHPTMSHGTVRFLKSVAHLYLKQLQTKREALAARPNISREALTAVDQKLSALREKIETGVFKQATVRPLLADEVVAAPMSPSVTNEVSEQSLAGTRVPRPVVLDSIEVVDPELRNRCLDLFGQFTETGQHDRLDTVISEATRILEDRLRRLAGAAPTVVGAELASYALSGSTPRIVLSAMGAEQEAAHLLFRGVFGFVRNRVHHHLVADVSPVRALQIVGTVDFLLSLLAAVPVTSGPA